MTEEKKPPFYITTTLPYVNADPHIGHALEFIRADVVARRKKISGYEVFFNTGTDEHGLKLFKTAEKAGKNVRVYVDEYAERFKNLLPKLGLLPEVHFIRTTDKVHEKAVWEFWRRVLKNGYIYKKNYKTQYCVGCESFKTNSELEEGKCLIHRNLVIETIEEENYFFKFSAFADKLKAFYDGRPDFVVPEFRLNEMREFVRRGLEDFSISRLKSRMPWGIEVPDDPEQVVYVWFDALTNYISTLGWPDNTDWFERFWVNGTPTQYCGKDNTRFQAVMWQAMLMAAGLPNSHKIVVNGFVTGEGGIKMSKSLGNTADPAQIVEEYGTDALRYFVLRELHSFEDSPFSPERFKETYNANLVNGLGNLVSRIMKMAVSNEIKITDGREKYDWPGDIDKKFEEFDFKAVMDWIWERVADLDGRIQRNEPFKKIKTNPEEGRKEIADLLFELRSLGLMLDSFLPETGEAIMNCVDNSKMPESPLFPRK